MLMASLVDSKGSVRKEAIKLCKGPRPAVAATATSTGKATGKGKATTATMSARAYRSEMRFVAGSVGLEDWADLLAEHHGSLHVEELRDD